MTLLELIAQQRTNAVLSTAVGVAIERMAEDTARDLLLDPAFREELRAVARESLRRAFADLRRRDAVAPKRKRRPRR